MRKLVATVIVGAAGAALWFPSGAYAQSQWRHGAHFTVNGVNIIAEWDSGTVERGAVARIWTRYQIVGTGTAQLIKVEYDCSGRRMRALEAGVMDTEGTRRVPVTAEESAYRPVPAPSLDETFRVRACEPDPLG